MRRAAAQTIVLGATVMMLGGCSMHAANGSHAGSVGSQVDRAELTASGASSLYDALVRTRWLFFRSRGTGSLHDHPTDAVLVFRGGVLMGTIESLHTLRPGDVRFVRRLTPMETYHKYRRRVAVAGLELELETH